ncbi:transglycosylase domain-containing protein [Actinophytocola sediminis]
MNDHNSHRRRSSQPAWPTADDPDTSGPPRQHEERTGFWSPLWEDDEDEAPRRGRSNGQSNGHSNGHANGHSNGRSNGAPAGPANGRSNGAPNGNGRASHRLPEAAAHRSEPPPHAGARNGSPAWPTEAAWPTEEPPAPSAPAKRPSAPNGMPAARPPADPRTRVVHPRPGGPGRPGGPRGPQAPGAIPDGPTEIVPPVHRRRTGPEPELLTHREPGEEVDMRDYDGDYDDEYEEENELAPEDQKRLRRKRIWRRVRRTGYVLTALMIIVPLIGFFIAYQVVEVPSPQSIADGQQQVAKITYADDKQLLSEMVPDGENRRMVKYEEIPEPIKHAVFAAEDAEFMTNPGFDISGVMRAVWNQVSGGQGGGSTITQQYIKKATGNEEKSITRKALEVVQAYKMNNTYSKEDIITAYLNTIYFGRGATGIAAAAKAYYGKELKDVTPSEAALLGGMIQSPSRFSDDEYMHRRWEFVLGQMVDNGWFPAEQAKTEKFPTSLTDFEKTRPRASTDSKAHIERAVMTELESIGITEQDVYRHGLVIKTTLSKRAQTAAVNSVHEVMKGQPKENLPALVAVDPANGAIIAYFGGDNGIGTDWAAAKQEPGSSFKPFDLVALLQEGKGLGETYDGTSGRTFPGREAPVRNSGGDSCGERCTVATAMEKSINTVFYDIAMNTVGTPAVARAAKAAGVTSDLNGERPDDAAPDGNIAIGGGDTRVSTLEMASAYATFASGGVYHKPHLISEVRYPDGQVRWSATADNKLAFDPEDQNNNTKIARNVTESLIPVLEKSDLECADGRDCAGKTGTHQFGSTEQNSKAWMVGYSSQLSAAVSMGATNAENKQVPLVDEDGNIVYGSGLPGEIWLKFMDEVHKGVDKVDFTDYDPIGKSAEEAEAEQRQAEEEQRRSEEEEQRREEERNREEDEDKPGNGDDKPGETGLPSTPPNESETDTPTLPTEDEGFPTFPTPGDGGNEN